MSSMRDEPFCGHCGERLPPFGAALALCPSCARRFRKVMPGPARAYSQRQREQPAGSLRGYLQVDEFRKDPLLATVLSTVFPGAGQVYNGHLLKALLVFATSPLVVPWLIGIADAFFSARRHNRSPRLAAEPAT